MNERLLQRAVLTSLIRSKASLDVPALPATLSRNSAMWVAPAGLARALRQLGVSPGPAPSLEAARGARSV